mgnify:CR=1 FL=1
MELVVSPRPQRHRGGLGHGQGPVQISKAVANAGKELRQANRHSDLDNGGPRQGQGGKLRQKGAEMHPGHRTLEHRPGQTTG